MNTHLKYLTMWLKIYWIMNKSGQSLILAICIPSSEYFKISFLLEEHEPGFIINVIRINFAEKYKHFYSDNETLS
jgi:hypothetical protein